MRNKKAADQKVGWSRAIAKRTVLLGFSSAPTEGIAASLSIRSILLK
jgi:hypothetical protein